MSFENIMKKCIPENANYHGVVVLEENPNVTVIEYDIDGVMGRTNFTKKNLSEFFPTPIIVPLTKAMSRADVYKFISDKFNLGLVAGIDYPDKTKETVAPSAMVESYPIAQTSYGYTGYFPVFISDGRTNIIHGASNRDVRDTPIDGHLEELKIQIKLGWKLFTSTSKMFNNYMPSIIFRNLLREYLDEVDDEYLDDLLYGHIEKAFNDGLSDCIILRTPMGRRYVVRFASSRGDLPTTK